MSLAEILRKIAKVATRLATAPQEIRDVFAEADRRIKADVAAQAAAPKDNPEFGMFDGPGSHVHAFVVLEQVAREKKVDLLKWWNDPT